MKKKKKVKTKIMLKKQEAKKREILKTAIIVGLVVFVLLHIITEPQYEIVKEGSSLYINSNSIENNGLIIGGDVSYYGVIKKEGVLTLFSESLISIFCSMIAGFIMSFFTRKKDSV